MLSFHPARPFRVLEEVKILGGSTRRIILPSLFQPHFMLRKRTLHPPPPQRSILPAEQRGRVEQQKHRANC